MERRGPTHPGCTDSPPSGRVQSFQGGACERMPPGCVELRQASDALTVRPRTLLLSWCGGPTYDPQPASSAARIALVRLSVVAVPPRSGVRVSPDASVVAIAESTSSAAAI